MKASAKRLKLDEGWILRSADFPLTPNLITSMVVHRRDPITRRSLDCAAVMLITEATMGRIVFLAPKLPDLPLRAVPQPFGGVRWLFACPRFGLSSTVIRPAGADHFAPRKAWGAVSYRSQRTAPRRRAADHAQRIRLALGGSADLAAPFPERPARMWRATHERRRVEAEAATNIALGGRPARSITTQEQPS